MFWGRESAKAWGGREEGLLRALRDVCPSGVAGAERGRRGHAAGELEGLTKTQPYWA